VFEAAKAADQPLPPIPLAVFGVTDPKVIAFCEPRLVKQPWRTVYQPAKALTQRPNIPCTYVRCRGFDPSPFIGFLAEMKKDKAVKTYELDTSHTCMLTDPKSTIDILANAP